MFKFLELIFSHAGCVGRAVWWWTQLITLVLVAGLLIGAMLTSERIWQLSSVEGVKNDTHLQSLSIPERNKEKRERISEDWNILYALATALLVLFWAHICISVKRWHDLGLSGYWVWIGIVPALAHAVLGVVIGMILSIAVPIGVIYFLGFRPGVYDDSPELQQASRSGWAVLNDVAGAVGLIVFVVAIFKFGFISMRPDITIVPPSLSEPESERAR